jgi:hypothetical protein
MQGYFTFFRWNFSLLRKSYHKKDPTRKNSRITKRQYFNINPEILFLQQKTAFFKKMLFFNEVSYFTSTIE